MGDIERVMLQQPTPPPPPTGHEQQRSVRFSEEAEDKAWYSAHTSHCAGSSYDDDLQLSGASSGSEVGDMHECCGNCTAVTDLECGLAEVALTPEIHEKDCRICHLSLEDNLESGIPIELGCSCKHDLAQAHKQCAETWFKIRGNKICEICGATAKNVVNASDASLLEHGNESNSNPPPPVQPAGAQSFWQDHRLINFLLACMFFAFVVSWLFHFNAPS